MNKRKTGKKNNKSKSNKNKSGKKTVKINIKKGGDSTPTAPSNGAKVVPAQPTAIIPGKSFNAEELKKVPEDLKRVHEELKLVKERLNKLESAKPVPATVTEKNITNMSRNSSHSNISPAKNEQTPEEGSDTKSGCSIM